MPHGETAVSVFIWAIEMTLYIILSVSSLFGF